MILHLRNSRGSPKEEGDKERKLGSKKGAFALFFFVLFGFSTQVLELFLF